MQYTENINNQNEIHLKAFAFQAIPVVAPALISTKKYFIARDFPIPYNPG